MIPSPTTRSGFAIDCAFAFTASKPRPDRTVERGRVVNADFVAVGPARGFDFRLGAVRSLFAATRHAAASAARAHHASYFWLEPVFHTA